MVIISKGYGANGKRQYELEELVTGQRATWVPPLKMERGKHRDALIQIASRLEASARQVEMDFSIAPFPMLEEVNAETPFGTYVTKVFIPRKTPKVAEKTLDGWKQYLKLRILPMFGDLPIGSITSGRIMDFFTGMQLEGLSFHTCERYYSFLNVVFKMAEKTGVISNNPMKMVDKPGPRKDELIEDGVEACTAEEIAQLLKLMEKEPLKWKVAIRLLIETGMRTGECMALQWSDIDWKCNAITIRASLGYTPNKGVYLTTPKNRRSRTVYVSDDMMVLLLSQYIDNLRKANSLFVNHQTDSPEPMHPQSPGKYLKRLAERHGLLHIHPHKLRHSYASIAISGFVPIESECNDVSNGKRVIFSYAYPKTIELPMSDTRPDNTEWVFCGIGVGGCALSLLILVLTNNKTAEVMEDKYD